MLTGFQTNFEHFLQKHRDSYEDNDLNIILISPSCMIYPGCVEFLYKVTKWDGMGVWKTTVNGGLCRLCFSFAEGTRCLVLLQK